MKIAVIVPAELPGEAREALIGELKRVASPGTDTDLFEIKKAKIRVAGDIDLLVPAAMDLAMKAEKNGFDAIVLNGA